MFRWNSTLKLYYFQKLFLYVSERRQFDPNENRKIVLAFYLQNEIVEG